MDVLKPLVAVNEKLDYIGRFTTDNNIKIRFVQNDYRGFGIGSAAFRMIERMHAQTGKRQVLITANTSGLLAFLAKNGYRPRAKSIRQLFKGLAKSRQPGEQLPKPISVIKRLRKN